jgi:hypothetical protein
MTRERGKAKSWKNSLSKSTVTKFQAEGPAILQALGNAQGEASGESLGRWPEDCLCDLRCPGRCPGLGEPVPLRGDGHDGRVRLGGEITTFVREPDAGNPPIRCEVREVETEHGMRPVRHRPGNPDPEYGETCPTAPLLNSTVFHLAFCLGWLTHPEKRVRINSVAMPWCRRGSADCLGDCRR